MGNGSDVEKQWRVLLEEYTEKELYVKNSAGGTDELDRAI